VPLPVAAIPAGKRCVATVLDGSRGVPETPRIVPDKDAVSSPPRGPTNALFRGTEAVQCDGEADFLFEQCTE
jgi:hypothetical protein